MFDLPWVPIFVFFSPLWWLLIFAAWCLFWAAMEYDSGKGATGVLVLTLFLMTAFGGTDFWQWLVSHQFNFWVWGPRWYIPGIVPGYVLCAAAWGVFRWFIYCRDDREEYEEVKAQWLEVKGLPGASRVPEDKQQEWVEYCAQYYPRWVATVRERDWTDPSGRKDVTKHVLRVRQYARNNKARITTWMGYWIFSASWWLLRDFVKKVFNHLYNLLGGVLDRISAWVYRGVEEDFNNVQTLTNPQRPKMPHER